MTLRERIAKAAEDAYCRTQAGDLPQTALFENVADAVLAEIAADGMVLVPREMTEDPSRIDNTSRLSDR